jgi:hypothetical protein
VFGLVTSVYWTFAVDLLVTGSGVEAGQAKVFWTVVGIAGIGGCLSGHLVLRSGHPALVAALHGGAGRSDRRAAPAGRHGRWPRSPRVSCSGPRSSP